MSPQLLERQKKYYFRCWVPLRFRPFFHCNEIKISLHIDVKEDSEKSKDKKNKNLERANKKIEELKTQLEDIFDRLDRHIRSNTLTDREISDYVAMFQPSRVVKRRPVMICNVYNEYVTATKPSWTEKSYQDVKKTYSIFSEFWNNTKPVADFLPQNASDYLKYLTELKAEGRNNNISYVMIKKHLSRIKAIFTLAYVKGYISINPFVGVKLVMNERKRADQVRKMFEESEIQKIVDHVLVYPKDAVFVQPSMFWVPLIAMFSGMRLNEICQLYKEDVVTIEGIPCMSINDSRPDQRIKNENSVRNVPVHKKLIEFGLLKYVDGLPDKTRLFPDLAAFRDGYGHSFKKFMPLIRDCVTDDKYKVFHSFRHGVATLLSRAKASTTFAADLLGHSRPGNLITTEVYTGRSTIDLLNETVNLIQFSNVNFEKCYIYKDK